MTQSVCPVEPGPVLGLDVAKHTVALFDGLTGESRILPNTPDALRAALEPLAGRALAVCEATGGYERMLLETAHALGLPIHRADPAKAKAFIVSHGGHAKTDKSDARWLARFGRERGAALARWTPPDADRETLAQQVRCRQHRLKQRTAAKNRLAAPHGASTADLVRDEIAFYDEQIAELDRRIAALQDTPALKPVGAVLTGIAGIGPVAASTLIALMPELGSLSRRQVASLAGLAPHPNDTGQFSGRRSTRGGRSELKPALFMAALSAAQHHPVLKHHYQRLVKAGKAKRVVLTAIARRLVVIANAKIRDANLARCKLT